jgi:hypothetical protein
LGKILRFSRLAVGDDHLVLPGARFPFLFIDGDHFGKFGMTLQFLFCHRIKTPDHRRNRGSELESQVFGRIGMNASQIHGLVPLFGKPLIPLNERIFFREPFSACLTGISSFSVKKNGRPLKPFEMPDLLITVVVDLSHFRSTTRATVGLRRHFDVKVNRMFTGFHFVDYHIFQTGEK